MTFEITEDSKGILIDALQSHIMARANYIIELEGYLDKDNTNKKRIESAIKQNRAAIEKAERLWCELSKLRES